MKGLWSEFFPSAADKPTTATSADISPQGKWSASPPRHQGQPHLLCPKCNAVACRPITSNTSRNPGRQFYSHDDCNFFKWADELKVKPNQFIYDVPNCGGCGAGKCRVRKETFGPDAGRIMFICRVKEGEGSCGYRVWQDELEISGKAPEDDRISLSQTMINRNDISATNAEFVEESKQIDERADDLTSMINTSENHQHQEGISQKIGQFKCQEDQPIESLRRPCNRSRCGDVKASGSLISARSLKVHLSMNYMPIRYCWIEDAIRQNLSSQLHGWWGRIAFHPMPCLITYASEPFTCYFSSPLDSIQDQILVNDYKQTILARSFRGVQSYINSHFNLKKHCNTSDYSPVVQENILLNSGDSNPVIWSLPGAESYSKPPFSRCRHNAELSGSTPFHDTLDSASRSGVLCETKTQNAMLRSISNAFCQAAQLLQNDLLTLLETMDVKDHEAVRHAAETTFAALGHLHFDHQDFKKRVMEHIHYASLLSEIEQSMLANDSHQKLAELCSSERARLEEMNRVHAGAIDTVTYTKNRLKALHEEISSTKDWLFQIESEACCFEVEMREAELALEIISKDKEVLEGKYSIASKELEESQKLFEQKQAECNAAKAAFDRSRALLRG